MKSCRFNRVRSLTQQGIVDRVASILILFSLLPIYLSADSVLTPVKDNSVEAQLASFEITEGYQINAFATEALGIANPVAIHFDSRDRLWVLCSLVYPQLVPTEQADDKLYILEDTDRDGIADHSKIFAENLNMPTGFALGDGGVYVGEGEDLIFLRDRDGDDRADSKETILSGFGTGDTHQNINSFTWSPDGQLLFCQGLHAFSRVQTPWGISRLDEHGVLRLRPRRLQMHTFPGVAGQNPWGIAFSQWGEGFVKGNGVTLSELTPLAVPVTKEQRAREVAIGRTAIKSMGALIVDSPALPKDIQGDVLIAGYYAHIVDRMSLSPDGAGHKTKNLPPLFRSDHNSFRPVDLKIGPDGAIYIADWYNPIIGHYQASLRHPNRDKKHGRIWRITAKEHELLPHPNIASLDLEAVVAKLGSPLRYERDRAREELSAKPTSEVVEAVKQWISRDGTDEHHLYEAICVLAWHEAVDVSLLDELSGAQHPQARAFAASLIGRWQDRLPDSLARLQKLVIDPHPRVRLEAVVASSFLDDPQGIVIAMNALAFPTDRFLESALALVAVSTREKWFDQLDKITFDDPSHLAYALKMAGGSHAAAEARELFQKGNLSKGVKDSLLQLLATSPRQEDMKLVLERGNAKTLHLLADAVEVHGKKFPLSKDLITQIADSRAKTEPLLRLIGLWKALAGEELIGATIAFGKPREGAAAVTSLAQIRGQEALPILQKVLEGSQEPIVVESGLGAMASLDSTMAAEFAAARLRDNATAENLLKPLLSPFLRQVDGLDVLAAAFGDQPLPPQRGQAIRALAGNAGAYSAKLDALLGPTVSQKMGIPEYSESLVKELTAAAKIGDAKAGQAIFNQAALSCVACHQIGEVDNGSAALGPALTAVGAGLPIELIIEAVLWPKRQVKEGYLASTIVTKSESVVSGYIQREDQSRIVIRDAVSGNETTIPTAQISHRSDAGTLMPAGLTANLSRAELVNLIAYLAGLKGT